MQKHIQKTAHEVDEATLNGEAADSKEIIIEQPEPPVTHGLTVFMAAVFMVGEMAGSGALALPAAVENTGWIGLVMIVFCGIISGYTAHVLGQCWTTVKERFPAMDYARYPYPGIGMLTFGAPGRLVISLSIDFTLFGVGCVFLLLASQNIQSMFRNNGAFDLSFCYWLMIVAACLCPLTMFATPKEFKFVAIFAAAATTIACVILVVLIGVDSKKNSNKTVIHDKLDPFSFAAAFGTMCFAFGAHPTFPTFINDMKQPQRFGISCLLAYTALAIIYLSVSAAGFFVYGNRLTPNVLEAVSHGPGLTIVQCGITIQLLCSYIISVNPLCQELEEIFRIRKDFSYQRVLMRTLVGMIILFTAEAIPSFGAILSLLGGSTTTILAFLAPTIFYFKLAYAKGHWPEIPISLGKKVLLLLIVLVGTLAGIFTTYSAVKAIASPDTFTVPCFINVTAAG